MSVPIGDLEGGSIAPGVLSLRCTSRDTESHHSLQAGWDDAEMALEIHHPDMVGVAVGN